MAMFDYESLVSDLKEESQKPLATQVESVQTEVKEPLEAIEPPFANLTKTRGLVVRFDLQGPPDAAPLLYIPGVTEDLRKELTKQTLAAYAKHFRTLTCDLRNQGKTRPFTLGEYIPLSTYVYDVLALVDVVFGTTTKLHIVGWSLGAILGLIIARLYPERVDKLVVISGGYWEPQPAYIGSLYPGGEKLFGGSWPWILDISAYDTLSVEERCARMLQHADIRRREPLFRETMKPSFETTKQIYARSENFTVMKNAKELGEGVFLQEFAVFAEGTPDIEEITTPTLIVHGCHDGMHLVGRAKVLKNVMRHAQLKVLEDQGHVMGLSVIGVVVEFLKKQESLDPIVHEEKVGSKSIRAIAMLDDLKAAFGSKKFQLELQSTRANAGSKPAEQARAIEQLCLPMLQPLVARYGFPQTCTNLEHIADVLTPELRCLPEIAYMCAEVSRLVRPRK